MIKITRKYKIDGIDDNFSINVVVPDCAVLLSKKYDSITEILTIELEYCDNTCLLNYNTIQILLTYNNGYCFFDKVFTITNDCDTFLFTDGGIKLIENCDTLCGVKIGAKVNQLHSTYTWSFDKLLFSREANADSSVLVLKPTESSRMLNNVTTKIKVVVTSADGCVLEDSLDYSICNPIIDNLTIDARCTKKPGAGLGTVAYISEYTVITTDACKDRVLDFTKVLNLGEFIPLTDDDISLHSYKFDVDATNKLRVSVKYKEIPFSTQLQIPLKIEICPNEIITYLITVNLLPCSGPNYSLGFEHVFDCDKCTNRFVQSKGLIPSGTTCPAPSVDLNDYVFSDRPIDWNTFTFIPISPPQSLISNFELSTPYASVGFNPLTQRVIYNSLGGLTTIDLVLFSVENIDGVLIEGELKFKKPSCLGDTLDINDSTVCLKIGEFADNIVLGPTGSTIEVIQFPVYNIVSIRGNKAKITTNSTAGQTDVFKYRVVSDGATSDEVTLTIYSYSPEVINHSYCLNNIGKFGINLNMFNTDTSTSTLGWLFAGYSTNINVIPGLNLGTFSVNNGQVKTYNINDLISFNNDAYIEFAVSGIYSFKLQNTVNNCGSALYVNIEIVNPVGLPPLTRKVICKTTGEVSLFNLISTVPANGVWTNIGSNISGTFNSNTNTITPSGELTNIPYTFAYSLTNSGLYNATACDSQLILEITVEDLPQEIFPACAVLCTLGPDPIIEPNCQRIEVEVDVPVVGCDLDLYSTYNLPSNARVKLISAPLNPVILHINGMNASYYAGDYLPSIINWSYYKAPIGLYKFEIVYGNSCERITTLDVTLVKGGCSVEDKTIVRCSEDAELNLLEEMSTATCQASSITQIVGTNETSFNQNTGIFNLNAPGYWEFAVGSDVDSDDADCPICTQEVKLTLTVNPLPGPGEAVPGTICDETCEVNIYPLFFNPNLSNLGVFRYNGFSTVYRPLRPICSPIWSITDGPLENVNLLLDNGQQGQTVVTPGTVIPTTIILHDAASLGYYYFSNTVVDANGCECTSQTVVQVVEPLVAGTGSSTIICSNDPQTFDLMSILTGEDPGGMWTVEFTPTIPGQNYTLALIQNNPGFWTNADQATFNSENQPTGTYLFKYTHTNPPATFDYYTGCESCGIGQATIQVDIIDSSVAGTGSSPSTCQ